MVNLAAIWLFRKFLNQHAHVMQLRRLKFSKVRCIVLLYSKHSSNLTYRIIFTQHAHVIQLHRHYSQKSALESFDIANPATTWLLRNFTCAARCTHVHPLPSVWSRSATENSREKWRKWISLMGSPCWPSASANHRQTGWGLHQWEWSDDACATQQRRPRHELAWIWTDF